MSKVQMRGLHYIFYCVVHCFANSGRRGELSRRLELERVSLESYINSEGFDGFISKPIDTDAMDAVLNKFIHDKHS